MKTQHTHSFAAGFFVGEGCISVNRKVTKKGYVRHIITCCIGNTELDILSHFERVYGGRVRSRKGTNLSKKPLWEWRTEGHTAEQFLKLVIPFLMGRKLLKAQYAIELRERMRGNREKKDLRGRVVTLTQSEINKMDSITKLLKAS